MEETKKCERCGRELTSLEIEYNAGWCEECEREDEIKRSVCD